MKPGVDFAEPFLMWLGPPFYLIFANLAYTAGPVYDVIAYRGAPRKDLLRDGYQLSVMLTAIPGVWSVIAWVWSEVSGKKFG